MQIYSGRHPFISHQSEDNVWSLFIHADSSDNELKSSDEAPVDHPSPQALTQAQEKVEELQKQLEMAKTRYQQLGGELEEESQIKLLEKEHNRWDGE